MRSNTKLSVRLLKAGMAIPADTRITTAVQWYRSNRKWSRERLAEESGVHPVTIQHLEKWRGTASASEQQALCRTLACPNLFNDDGTAREVLVPTDSKRRKSQ